MNSQVLNEIDTMIQHNIYDMALTKIGKVLETLLWENLTHHSKRINKPTLEVLLQETRQHIPNLSPSFSIHCNTIQRFRNLSAHHNQHIENRADVLSAYHALLHILNSEPFSTLNPSLKPSLERILEQQQRPNPSNTTSFFKNVHQIYQSLERNIKKCPHEERTVVKNIGLDLETTWPQLKRTYLIEEDCCNIHFQILLMDHTSTVLQPITGKYISLFECETVELAITRFIQRNAETLSQRGISFELRRNPHIPMVHGFLINHSHLYWSFCQMKDTQLDGGLEFYHYSETTIPGSIGEYYMRVYEGWFDTWWSSSDPVIELVDGHLGDLHT